MYVRTGTAIFNICNKKSGANGLFIWSGGDLDHTHHPRTHTSPSRSQQSASPAHDLGNRRDRHLCHLRVGNLPRVPPAAVALRAAEVEVDRVTASLFDGEDRVAESDA